MQGARYLNTRTRTWPSISNHDKSAYVDSVGEVKTTGSSGASNKLKLADGRGPARLAAWASKKQGLDPEF